MFDALAAMSTGKVVALTVFGALALIVIIGAAIALSAILGPGMVAVRGEHGVKPRRPMSASARVLGVGIVLLAVGVGILLGALAASVLGAWGMFGIVIISAGIGLVLFYLVVARAEKRQRPAADEAAESAQGS